MFSSLFLAAALAAASPAPPLVALPPVIAATTWSADSVLLFHDGSFTIASPLALRITDPTPNAFGFPSLAVDDATGGGGPHVYETAYTSAHGNHTVRTPCSGYQSVEECARRHKAALDALQAIFPRI